MTRPPVISQNCWALCAPDGPSTPFSAATLWLDLFRVVVMVLGVALIVLTPRLVFRAKALGQQCRLLGQAVFATITVGTEVDHLGDYAHYRLVLSFVGVVLMLYGVYRMKFEVPPETRSEHRVRDE